MEKLHIDIAVDNGKYRFTQDNKGHVAVFRHGEPWIDGSFIGINMVIAMACEIEAQRALRAKIGCGLRQIADSMIQDPLQAQRAVQEWTDRVNGFAAELEATDR